MKKSFICALAAVLCMAPLAACAPQVQSDIPEEIVSAPTTTPAPEPEPLPLPEEPTLPSEETPAEQQPELPAPEPPKVPDPPEPEQPLTAKYIYVHSDGLNVRAGAGTAYTSLGKVEKDVLLKFVRRSGDWYETTYKNRKAYVSANSVYTSVVSMETADEQVENVIEEGLRLLGVPYVYGAVRLHDGRGNFLSGFTVTQFDCSSLMQYMFYHGAGKLLNTTTRTQVSQGKEVAKKNIRRGDLLFFTNASRKNNTGIERIGHVALYLGDNYILHTASDYAKIEQISATRWSYYITARRMI